MGELSIRSLFFVSTFVPAMGVLLITGTLALVAHLKLRLPRSSSTKTRLRRARMAGGVLATVALVAALIFLQTWEYGYRWYISAIVLIIALPIIWHFQFQWASILYMKVRNERPPFARDDFDGYSVSNLRFGVFFAIGVFALVLAVFLTWFLSSFCFCSQPHVYSFAGTRAFEPEPSTCESSEAPCHVYFTLGYDVSSQLVAHFHAGVEYAKPVIFYSPLPDPVTSGVRVSAASLPVTPIAGLVSRWVYRALITLPPGSDLYFAVGDADKGVYSTPRRVRMLPSNATQFTFTSGGDLGYRPDVSKPLLRQLVATEPYFFGLGGDIAYANSFAGCYRRWDQVLDMLEETLVTPTGYTVPIIASIGNHEAGLRSPPVIVGGRTQVPYYYRYFWHGPAPAGVIVDDAMDPTWHTHVIGRDSILVVLDTDIVNGADGKQLEYLKQALDTDRPNRYALYHVPLYPGLRPFEGVDSAHLRQSWLETFDSRNLTVALENHDHVYIRSHVLRNNQVVGDDAPGTLYIGDGSLGVDHSHTYNAVESAARFYVARVEADNFFLRIDVDGRNTTVSAINLEGTVVDAVSRMS